jgi:NAD(P)-dependent dehydrogenase (short-subunit alcohol dehydrogenase family)
MTHRVAVVVGHTGGIGRALYAELRRSQAFDEVVGLSRPNIDLVDQPSIERAAATLKNNSIHLLINAAGLLHDVVQQPEKSLRSLDPIALARSFAVNATGPALLMKHFFPLLARHERSIFASLSARVGSIGDNQLGGWYAYRASKAALNQLVRTAAIELARTHPHAICLALHPGTVATNLSQPFVREGRLTLDAAHAARHLLAVIEGLRPEDTGGFFDWRGAPVPW